MFRRGGVLVGDNVGCVWGRSRGLKSAARGVSQGEVVSAKLCAKTGTQLVLRGNKSEHSLISWPLALDRVGFRQASCCSNRCRGSVASRGPAWEQPPDEAEWLSIQPTTHRGRPPASGSSLSKLERRPRPLPIGQPKKRRSAPKGSRKAENRWLSRMALPVM